MSDPGGHGELSRPWFDRELRLGRRVIWQWRPEVRFGAACSPGLRGRTPVNGVKFPDEAAAARFDLNRVIVFRGDGSPAGIRQFVGWQDAEAWVREGG